MREEGNRMRQGTILFCPGKHDWPRLIVYNALEEYSLGIYVNDNGECEIYPERYSKKELSDRELYIPVGHVDLGNVILDAVKKSIVEIVPRKTLVHT